MHRILHTVLDLFDRLDTYRLPIMEPCEVDLNNIVLDSCSLVMQYYFLPQKYNNNIYGAIV